MEAEPVLNVYRGQPSGLELDISFTRPNHKTNNYPSTVPTETTRQRYILYFKTFEVMSLVARVTFKPISMWF